MIVDLVLKKARGKGKEVRIFLLYRIWMLRGH